MQKCIALILFICQDTFHSAAVPFVLSGGSFNSPLGESLRNGMRCQSGQKQAVNFTHDFRLGFIHNQFSARTFIITEKLSKRNIQFSVCHALSLPPDHVF